MMRIKNEKEGFWKYILGFKKQKKKNVSSLIKESKKHIKQGLLYFQIH